MPDEVAKSIPGGYYLKARAGQNSAIATAPPHVREIWDWLLRESNHKGMKTHGRIIQRGQVLTDYYEIQDGLHWREGFIKKTYKKHHVDYAMRWLKAEGMITTQKSTRKIIITVCNYEFYQNPKNYEKGNDYDRPATANDMANDMANDNGYDNGHDRRKIQNPPPVSTSKEVAATDYDNATELVNDMANDMANDTINKKEELKKKNNTFCNSDELPKNGPAPVIKLNAEKKKTAAEKIADTTPHWQALVKTWFDFNVQQFKEEPSFKGTDPRNLKTIVHILEKRATAKGEQWTEATAVNKLQALLVRCFADPWLSKNFLLPNIEKQLDKFIQNQNINDGANNKHQPPAGGSRDKSAGASTLINQLREGFGMAK